MLQLRVCRFLPLPAREWHNRQMPQPMTRVALYRSATTDAAGLFALSDIAPGSYQVIAWEDIPEGAEKNAEFIREYEDRGVRVTVGSGESLQKLQLSSIPAKQQ